MNFEQHYGEQTPDIRVSNTTPYANSMPMNRMFLGKKFGKALKQATFSCDCYMNVCYEKEQSFEDGTVLKWELDALSLDVYVIGSTKLFVKGKHVWAYCMGIIE